MKLPLAKPTRSKTIITSSDVREAASAGIRELPVPSGAIVSGEARDEAGRRGIALVPEASSAKVEADARPREPAQRVQVRARADAIVKGGRIALPGQGLVDGDVIVGSGRVLALGTSLSCDGLQVDANGLLVMPGAFDPHVHLGLFGSVEEELQSEGSSAILGGVTSIGWFIGGPGSHLGRLKEIRSSVERLSPVDIVPHLVIAGRDQLAEIPEYVSCGVRSFKVYMCGLPGLIKPVDDAFLTEVFEALRPYGDDVVVCIHAENESLVNRALEKYSATPAGEAGLANWAQTHPALAEEEAVARACLLSRDTGTRIYFVHISSSAGLEALRRARADRGGRRVLAETTSPYLASPPEGTDEATGKMVPPLRGRETVDRLWHGFNEGLIDTIGTDNVTMTRQEKGLGGSWHDVVPGYPALGSHLPALFEEGYHRRGIDLMKLVGAVTRRPAEVFGVYPRKGTLLPGSDADLVVVDLNEEREIHSRSLGSRSDFSLMEGRVTRGWPVLTMKAGRVVALSGAIRERPSGRLLLQQGTEGYGGGNRDD